MNTSRFALSTNWNSHRHDDGHGITDEILQQGFQTVECGYRLNRLQAESLRKRVEARDIAVCSVHAFAPYSCETRGGGPEVFSLCDLQDAVRMEAVALLRKTLEWAQSLDAGAVIVHAGRVRMSAITPSLQSLRHRGHQDSRRFRWRFNRLMTLRERRSTPHLEALCRSMETLLPDFEKNAITLCLENLPEWEAVPHEAEMRDLHRRFHSPSLRYWHDIGHGHVRDRLGFGAHHAWAERLRDICAGVHLHDNDGCFDLHAAPHDTSPALVEALPLNQPGILKVLEPNPGMTPDDLQAYCRLLDQTWPDPSPDADADGTCPHDGLQGPNEPKTNPSYTDNSNE